MPGPTLKSTLRPHQVRVFEKLKASGGVVAAHQMGSGKTLTSIGAGVHSGLPMDVVVPAPLVPNFQKEVRNHVEGELPHRVRSYERAARDATDGDWLRSNHLVVFDEAHRLRNAGTKRTQLLAHPARNAKMRLLLTGSPIYNNVSDLAPLVNIAAGKSVLPEDPTEFRRRFVHEEQVRPGFLGRMMGVQPGIRRAVKNREELVRAMAGRIDMHTGDTEHFPAVQHENIEVPMSPGQHRVYQYHMGKVPFHIRWKIKRGLPPSKQESKSLNAFMGGVRQTSLSPRPYISGMTDEQEAADTPKIQEAARRLVTHMKSDPNFRGVVYSNYLGSGLHPYSRALHAAGVPHTVFTGQVSPKDRGRLVQDFNEGRTPVMLVSSAGTEGLDLKGTKLIQALEPHFNEEKIKQLVGRGARYRSHSHLPEAERSVKFERYVTAMPQRGRLARAIFGQPRSAEQYIFDRAQEKDRLSEQFQRVLREAHEAPFTG